MSERDKNSVVHLHNRLKEQEDEEQIAFVKKGIKEGSQYIRRQMQRNRVQYDAYSDEEDEKKKVVISAMSDDEETDEENEEEMYLKQIRREELYNRLEGREDQEKEEDEESDKEEEDDGEKFDSEEEREMEQFKKRIEQKQEVIIVDCCYCSLKKGGLFVVRFQV